MRATPAPSYPAKSRIYPWAPEAKVFCFFSSEKKILPYTFDFVMLAWHRRGVR
jgi:hypothetical protein